MIPLITCETTLGQYVCKLVFGINIFDLDLRVQVDSVKRPIKCNSVGSGHVSRRRTSAFNDHLDYHIILNKNVKQSAEVRRFCVCGTVIHIG